MAWSDDTWRDPERPWQEGDSPTGCLLTLAIVTVVAAALVSVAGG